MTGFDLSQLQKNITDLGEKHEDILAIYLYGSWVEGRAIETSDLDLGILLREGLSKREMWRLEDKLTSEFGDIWRGEVDARVMNIAPLAAQFEVITRGKVVYVADIDKVADLESRISRKYWDFKEIEDEYNRCYIERQKEALDEAERTEYQSTLRKIRSVHQRVKEAAKLKSRGI